jgi:tetratricopeptide (TPR) repeat protein
VPTVTVVNSAVVWADPNERPAGSGATKGAPPQSVKTTDRAKELYEAATWYRLRGELPSARLRLQEALESDPTFTDARQDLAGVLLLQGNHSEAAKLYQEILAQVANHRGAMKGLALAAMAGRDYASARRVLTRLAAIDDADGEVWLNLGDVCFLAGDRQAAREYWTKAAPPGSNATAIAEQARMRLAAYAPLPLPRD